MERVPEALRKEIGNRLRQLRKEKGLTLSEASEKAGLAKSTYGGFESGFRAPSINSLRKLAKSLNVSSDFLLFGYSEELDLAILLNRSDLNFSAARLSFEERKKIKEYIEFLLSKRDGDD